MSKNERGVEEFPTLTLLLWENDCEQVDTFCMQIDDIQNKELYINDDEEATLKGRVDPTINGEELSIDVATMD